MKSVMSMGRKEASPVPSAEDAQMAEEEMYSTVAPQGVYTSSGLAAIVAATNKLLPLFGQEPTYPKLSGKLKVLPTDFVRILSMFKSAIDDAIAEEEIDAEMSFDLSDITDDASLIFLAGKISRLAKDKMFKKFLSSPPKKETGATEAGEDAGMSEEETPSSDATDQLFMSRM